MRFEVKANRAKFRNLNLKPGIDPTDPDLESSVAQTIYIFQHAQEFFNSVEMNVLGKMLADIDFILERGWAENISPFDFFHGHICGKSLTPILNVSELLSPDNIFVLYHTHEVWLRHPTKSVLSSMKSRPTIVEPRADAFSVGARHLGLMDIADVHFKITANGPYKLKNGVELDVCGILCKDEIWEFLQ
jgi:hypothetical protein